MSDFGPSGSRTPTRGDTWRYVWLGVLASLVLLVLLSRVDGALVILLAVYLVAACLAALVHLVREERS